MIILIKCIGWSLSRLPDPILQGLCWGGALIWRVIMPKRFGTAYRNISKCFPEQSSAWCKQAARISFSRTAEMAVFALISPYWSDEKFKRRLSLSQDTLDLIESWNNSPPRPKIFLNPHYCYVEMTPHIKAVLADQDIGEVGVIFRPLNQKPLDDWIKNSRERHDVRLLSRKKGFQEARNILKNNGSVAVLFDQRAGGTGSLIMCQGRLSSVTDLPAMLAKESLASVYLVITKRLGFMRCQIETMAIPKFSDPSDITLLSNQAFDEYLVSHKESAPDWLWAHDRWRTHYKVGQRLNLKHKRSLLDRQKKLFGWHKLPQKTRIWIRMPFDFEEFVQGLFFAHAVSRGRPDAEVTLIGPEFGEWIVNQLDLDVEYLRLKIPFLKKWGQHIKWRKNKPDTVIVLQRCNKTAIETISLNCPQTVGMDCNKGSRLFKHRAPVGETVTSPSTFEDYFSKHLKLGKYMGLEKEKLNLDSMMIPQKEQINDSPSAFVIIKDEEIEKIIISILRQDSPTLNIYTFRFFKPDPVPTSLLWPEIFSNFRHKRPTIVSDQISWVLLAHAFDLPGLFIKNNQSKDIGLFPDLQNLKSQSTQSKVLSLLWEETQKEEFQNNLEYFFNDSKNNHEEGASDNSFLSTTQT